MYRGVTGYNFQIILYLFLWRSVSVDIDKMLFFCGISSESSLFEKVLIKESLVYKGLMLIQWLCYSFKNLIEELWMHSKKVLKCVYIFGAKPSCYINVEKYPSCCIRSSENQAHRPCIASIFYLPAAY